MLSVFCRKAPLLTIYHWGNLLEYLKLKVSIIVRAKRGHLLQSKLLHLFSYGLLKEHQKYVTLLQNSLEVC